MPDLHLIKLLLGIKDGNIQITHVEKRKNTFNQQYRCFCHAH
ncbi:hypothetical protein N8C51_15070 (plasmid) [Enterococcus faecium]